MRQRVHQTAVIRAMRPALLPRRRADVVRRKARVVFGSAFLHRGAPPDPVTPSPAPAVWALATLVISAQASHSVPPSNAAAIQIPGSHSRSVFVRQSGLAG